NGQARTGEGFGIDPDRVGGPAGSAVGIKVEFVIVIAHIHIDVDGVPDGTGVVDLAIAVQLTIAFDETRIGNDDPVGHLDVVAGRENQRAGIGQRPEIFAIDARTNRRAVLTRRLNYR